MPMTPFLSAHGTFFLSFIAAVANPGHLSNCYCSGIIFLTVRDLLRHATILIHVPRCEFPFISPFWDCWGLLALRIRVLQQTVLENSVLFPVSVLFLFKQFSILSASLCVSLCLFILSVYVCVCAVHMTLLASMWVHTCREWVKGPG